MRYVEYTGEPLLSLHARLYHLQFAGHVARMEESRIPRRCLKTSWKTEKETGRCQKHPTNSVTTTDKSSVSTTEWNREDC